MIQTTSSTLERCGFCGRFFIGHTYIMDEQLLKYSAEELDAAPLGYCDDSQEEYYRQNGCDYPEG